jgi:hypothetical protein
VTYEPAKTGPQKIAESISKTGFRATVKGGQALMPRNAKSVGSVDLQALKDWFNAAQGSVRFVSLLSPSCPMCQSGHGVLKSGFIVWLPMLSGDDEAAVTGQSATFHDDRVGEGWDQARHVGADQKLCLNPARLRREVASRVARR